MPQGSFGPLLFSSIPKTLSDDKKLEFRLNKTYNRGAEWYLANELTLNEDKSEYICLYISAKQKDTSSGSCRGGGGGQGGSCHEIRMVFFRFHESRRR